MSEISKFIVPAMVAVSLLPGSSATQAALPRLDRSADPVEQINRFVNNYDGGDCFFVTTVKVTETTAILEGDGDSVIPFERLDLEFKRQIGFRGEDCFSPGPIGTMRGGEIPVADAKSAPDGAKSLNVLRPTLRLCSADQVFALLLAEMLLMNRTSSGHRAIPANAWAVVIANERSLPALTRARCLPEKAQQVLPLLLPRARRPALGQDAFTHGTSCPLVAFAQMVVE
jgi:hypothetical protein